ncbi:MAG: hypothetical protein NVS3B12_27260 [Acidimicrobiales bacterium]
MLVLVGLAWLSSTSGILEVSFEGVLAVVLVILGATMVLTARTDWALSRRAWPVLTGAVVILALVGTSTAGSAIGAHLSNLQFGPQTAEPTSWVDAATPITNFAGPVSVNLLAVSPQPGDHDEVLRIRTTAGPIDLTVPTQPPYHLRIHTRTTFGPVRIGDRAVSEGGFSDHTVEYPSAGATGPLLDVEVSAGAGPVTVHPVSTPPGPRR